MAQKKANEVDLWLARPDPRVGIVLLYGPDRGLVSERARRFAQASGVPLDDPFSTVRLGADGEPGRILDEARTLSMFSAKRLIWVRDAGSQKPLLTDLEALIAAPAADAILLIEAGELRKNAPLRQLVEAARADLAMALPCYPDEGRGLDALIDEEMKRGGINLSPDARQALKASLGGDRLASRGELEKLRLYAGENAEIGLSDVLAVTGDAAALTDDQIVDRTLAGDRPGLAALMARHLTTERQVQPLLAAALRAFAQLHGLRGRMEAERTGPAQAVGAMRPQPFGDRKAALERGLARWDAEGLRRAVALLQATVLESRRRPDLAVALAERALLALSGDGRPKPA